MASDEGTIPYLAEAVSEWSEDLVGFEPTTEAFDPRDTGDLQQLAVAIHDARQAGADFKLAKDERGRLTLWTKASEFWPT